MPTYVSICDGSKPEYEGGPQPEKQSLYFGCNYDDKPTVVIQWVKKGKWFVIQKETQKKQLRKFYVIWLINVFLMMYKI